MSERKDSLSRAQLIGGMIATGALASCGGGINTTPAASRGSAAIGGKVRSISASRVALNDILTDPVFKEVDTAALARTFDRSPQIAALARGYFAQTRQQPQTSKVIRRIPSTGIVIDQPGTYTFAGNILWRPTDAPSSAITIASSDVTLDLAGFTLAASVFLKSQQFTGILVLGPVANVTIANGVVANLTEYGILAGSVYGLKVSGVTVTGICMQNLSVRNLTPAGIAVMGSAGVAISDCSVKRLDVTTDSSAGIFIQNTIQAAVTRCRAAGLTNRDGAVTGFSCISCIGVTTSKCTASSLQTHFNGNVLTTGHTVLGFCPISCSTLTYVDCSASGLIGCCDDCHGMSVFLDGQVTVTRFRAQHVVDGVSPSRSGAKATGLEVYGQNVTIIDSNVSDIKAINPQDKQATGFSAWGSKIRFENCTATNVTVQGTSSTGSHAEGFGWAPDPRIEFAYVGATDVTYADCAADRCQVGFDTWYHQHSQWIRPKYTNCATKLLVEPGAKRTLSCDGCSECVIPFSVTLTNNEHGNTVNGRPIA